MHSESPLIGDGDSSFDFRFSERGGKNAVGDVLGVAPPPLPDEELLVIVVVLAVLVALIAVREAPRPPFVVPFLNFECTCAWEKYIELRVSVKLLKSGVSAALLPRFPRPFGVRESNSSVGESQNLGGAQSCRVQSSKVPTYVLPRHVTFTTRTPPSVSCQTMPSSVTEVPGSQGPKQSGSVIVPTEVPIHMSTISLGEELDALEESPCFARLAGGDFMPSSTAILLLDVLVLLADAVVVLEEEFAGTEIVWCTVAEIIPGAISFACATGTIEVFDLLSLLPLRLFADVIDTLLLKVVEAAAAANCAAICEEILILPQLVESLPGVPGAFGALVLPMDCGVVVDAAEVAESKDVAVTAAVVTTPPAGEPTDGVNTPGGTDPDVALLFPAVLLKRCVKTAMDELFALSDRRVQV